MDNFKLLKTGLSVQGLLSAIERQPHLWGEITERQTVPGSPHKYTEAIFIRWCETRTIAAAFTEIPAIDYPARENLPEVDELIFEAFNTAKANTLGRVLIAKLAPGGNITPHADEGDVADYYERFHIPLCSEPGNVFHAGDPDRSFEGVHMKPGELWWFNHKKQHWLFNGSDKPRIHLIIDAVAPCYRRERHEISN